MPRWKKHGLIHNLQESLVRSNHMQVPTPLVFPNFIRMYYAGRKDGKSFPAYVDIDRKTFSVIKVNEEPIMSLGNPGEFDSDGIMPGTVIKHKDELWMYYTGWNARAEGARYQNEIGIAVSADGGNTFTKKFPGPIIGRSSTEPGLAVTPFVMKHGDILKMWYISGVGWNLIDGKYEPVYVIKYAESADGIKWERFPLQCIESRHDMEAFSHPSVILAGNTWHIWYCYRDSHDYRDGTGAYRIGYGQSGDGITFKRYDSLAGIETGVNGGWDAKQLCYPHVLQLDSRLIMFYNGNSFGQTGIGWAEYVD